MEAYIRHYWRDVPVMAEVSRCESHFTQYTRSGTPLKGKITPRDTGVMQVNKDYHEKEAERLGTDLDHIDGNLEYGRHLYNKNGLADWSASQSCWSHYAQR